MTRSELPACDTLTLRRDGGALHVTLDRPRAKNAMNQQMVGELTRVFDELVYRPDLRVVVLRGAGGTFCAGGDVKEMAAARAMDPAAEGGDPLAATNRRFGAMISKVDRAAQAVIAVLEGAVLGGGIGLACVADVTIARADATVGLPETSLGLAPAQIAPFLVRRVGVYQARRLAVTAARLDGLEAQALGLVHHVCASAEELEQTVEQLLARIHCCAPGAIAATKALMAQVGQLEHEALLDECARVFAASVRGAEGSEGTRAFVERRPPSWRAEED